MKIQLTAVFEKSPYGYIGYVEELPGVNTQGETLEEAKRNLIEAIQLVLEANRQMRFELPENTEVNLLDEVLCNLQAGCENIVVSR